MYVAAASLDELLRRATLILLNTKRRIRPTRGEATETTGVLLRLFNPRARLARTGTTGRLFSSLGELLWYLARSNDLQFITYFLSRYKKESEDGKTVYGGYGPRLFRMRGRINQVQNVIKLLKKNPVSRRAVIQLFDATDIQRQRKEIPCTCTMQFMIRRRRLDMITSMRSNDVFYGLPHDVFAFTMLQEIVARSLGVELGTYTHMVGSLHLYKEHTQSARELLKRKPLPAMPMPRMPNGNPWEPVSKLLRAEHSIRAGRNINIRFLKVERYWEDLVRLLQIYYHSKRGETAQIERLKKDMSTGVYDWHVDGRRQDAERRMSKSGKP